LNRRLFAKILDQLKYAVIHRSFYRSFQRLDEAQLKRAIPYLLKLETLVLDVSENICVGDKF